MCKCKSHVQNLAVLYSWIETEDIESFKERRQERDRNMKGSLIPTRSTFDFETTVQPHNTE